MKESTMTAGLRERTLATAASSLGRERPCRRRVFAESGKVSGSARRRAVSRPMPSFDPVTRMTLPMLLCGGAGEEDWGEDEEEEKEGEEARIVGGE